MKNFVFENKTKDILKTLENGHPEETSNHLAFSLDVIDNGRIDFLINNYSHLVFIWNLVNQVLGTGSLVEPAKYSTTL